MSVAITQPKTSRESYNIGIDIWRSLSEEEQRLPSRQLAQLIAERGCLPLAVAAAVVASVRASELRYWINNE